MMDTSLKGGKEQNLTLAKVSNQKYAMIDVPESFSVSLIYNIEDNSIFCDDDDETEIDACDIATPFDGSVY